MDPEKQSTHTGHCLKLQIESFDILKTLGTGAFSRVKLARPKEYATSKPLVLKIFKKHSVLKNKQIERLRNEKCLLEQLQLPNLPKLFGSFQDSRYVYFVMEYICGGELFSRIKRLGTLPVSHCKFYAGEITVILESLHSAAVLYRDLKPENLLIDGRGHIKLVDFGLARQFSAKHFTLCGTPEYMAPEVILGKGYGLGVDWWALGIVLYEMLLGHPPYRDPHPMNIYQKIVLGRLKFPIEVEPEAKNLIEKLLEPDVEKRLGGEATRAHRFFEGVRFEALGRGEVPAPWVPELLSEDDTSHFETYPNSTEPPPVPTVHSRDPFTGF